MRGVAMHGEPADANLLAPSPRRFWGWPGGKDLAYAYLVLGPLLTVWFVGVFAGTDYLARQHHFRVRLYLPWELSIPFVPAAAAIYNTLHGAYAAAPFILRTRAEMNAMAATWALVTAAAGVLFVALPFEVGYAAPLHPPQGVWKALYDWADHANLTFNTFPSLHVAWSLACVDVYARHAPRWGKWLLWLWGAAMVLSTLLTHFHHVADVLGGLALALFGSRVVYPRQLAKGRRAASAAH